MQALAFPNAETEDDDVGCSLIKGQLLPGLRSFCSALRVCEQVCDHYNVFDDGKHMFMKIDNFGEVRELAKNKEFCTELEERVINWIKGVAKVLMESEQLRKENDTSGPQDELEYWKKRGAQFSQLLAHLNVCQPVTARKNAFSLIFNSFVGQRGSIHAFLLAIVRLEDTQGVEGNGQEDHLLLQ